MGIGGRPKERLQEHLAAKVRSVIRQTLKAHKDLGQRISHRDIAMTTTKVYPVARDEKWVRKVLAANQPLTPAAFREIAERMAAAGARIPRHLLIGFEKAVVQEPRPVMLLLPQQGKQLARMIARAMAQQLHFGKSRLPEVEAIIAETVEPYEEIFQTDLGKDTVDRLRALWGPLEQVFDGRTMALEGRPVRRGALTQTLQKIKVPKPRYKVP